MNLTPQQVAAISGRVMARCTFIDIRPWGPTSRSIEVSQFERQRLLETVKIGPSGTVKVLA